MVQQNPNQLVNSERSDPHSHLRSLPAVFAVRTCMQEPCMKGFQNSAQQAFMYFISGSWLTAIKCHWLYGPRQANLVLIAYASSEGSGEPAHPRSLARTFAARS